MGIISLSSEMGQEFLKSAVSSAIDDPYPVPPNVDDSETISLAFLISLSVTFALLMVVLVVIAVYVTFCGADESEYDEEAGPGGLNLDITILWKNFSSSHSQFPSPSLNNWYLKQKM